MVTKEVDKFLVKRLLSLRRSSLCTSLTLQHDLAREMHVRSSDGYTRKILQAKGYQWLPRRQKRLYSAKQRKARVSVAQKVLQMTRKDLKTKLSFQNYAWPLLKFIPSLQAWWQRRYPRWKKICDTAILGPHP